MFHDTNSINMRLHSTFEIIRTNRKNYKKSLLSFLLSNNIWFMMEMEWKRKYDANYKKINLFFLIDKEKKLN